MVAHRPTAAAIVLLALAGCRVPSETASKADRLPIDCVTGAASLDSLATLVQALQRTGLVETLRGEGPFTLFAPTDQAFAALPGQALGELLDDTRTLRRVLRHHVVPGEFPMMLLARHTDLPALEGPPLRIEVVDGAPRVGGARILLGDVRCSNGVIHTIDRVLLP